MAEYVLGIDTSNYRTSVALVDSGGKIILNHRELLEVPEGERGLRQSEAFFRHVLRLPEVIERFMEYRAGIAGVSVSTRPRPVEGSYMPCFMAGYSFAKALAAALDVPLTETSHQEGHIEAIRFSADVEGEDIVFFHFSGGTTEAILRGEIIGGTKDISYGQLIDRAGVKAGFAFPAGEALDGIAIGGLGSSGISTVSGDLSVIKLKDGYVNLSGIETQALRSIICGDNSALISELFEKISESILNMTVYISKKYRIRRFVFAGGVSCSAYLRRYLELNMPDYIKYHFGDVELSGDNAVGTALIGLREIRKK